MDGMKDKKTPNDIVPAHLMATKKQNTVVLDIPLTGFLTTH